MSEYQQTINWYPGHMAKAKRLLQDQFRRADLIIEVCDARLPYSSRNPDLMKMTGTKQHILLLNKADLADPDTSQNWIRHFRNNGVKAHLISADRLRTREIISLIEQSTRQTTEKALTKGIRKTIRVIITGIPNVGKSTLINHLYGRSVAQIGDRPGVTRSNQWVKISPYLELLDTPGLLWPRLDDQLAARRLCYIGSVRDEIIDTADLTIHLLEDLCRIVPEHVMERFHISDPTLTGVDLLDSVCSGRGWLLKGAQYDYDRCCSIVLDEYRAGKLGRITLEKPEEIIAGREFIHDQPYGTRR